MIRWVIRSKNGEQIIFGDYPKLSLWDRILHFLCFKNKTFDFSGKKPWEKK